MDDLEESLRGLDSELDGLEEYAAEVLKQAGELAHLLNTLYTEKTHFTR